MKRRAVIVGCGHMATGWAKSLTGTSLAERVEICALVDPNLAMAQKLQADLNLQAAVLSTDLATVLAEVNPDLVFDIAVPSALMSSRFRRPGSGAMSWAISPVVVSWR